MDVLTDRINDVVVAKARGSVDGTNATEFEKALSAAVSENDRAMVIDLEQLSHISSAGLRIILLIAKAMRRHDGKLAMCSPQAPIREMFHISGFDKIIPVHGSRAAALDSLGS